MKTGYPSIDKTHLKGENFFEQHPIIPSISIENALRMISLSYRKEIALDCLDLQINYDELIKNTALIARAFKALGIKKGDIVTISMPNIYQAVVSFFALNRIGACATFLNSFSTKEEIIKYLNEFESPIFINYDKNYDYNLEIKNKTKVKQIITLSKSDVNKKNLNQSDNTELTNFINFNDLGIISKYYKQPYQTIYNGSENALILFTSGTTGIPKEVVLTNQNVLGSCIYLKNSAKIKPIKGEKSLVCVPFTYPYGFSTSTLTSLLCGRTAVLGPNLSKENINYYLSKKPNIIFGSPALLELIQKNIEIEDLSSIHTFISGGDFLVPSKINEAKEFFKKHNATTQICNGSGNAETVGANTNAVGLPIKVNTVGKILTGTDAIIMNEDYTKELKYGEEGKLCISGKHIFKEYYKKPLETNQTKFMYKGKLFYKTGNRGILYEDGYFELTGRDSRFYIISTLNKIYCDRVQTLMSYIDEIEDVAFVGKENNDLLYVGVAYIVLKKGIEPTEETKRKILEKCSKTLTSPYGDNQQLKEYEIPAVIEFVDKLPRTKADKIDYKNLEEKAKILELKK